MSGRKPDQLCFDEPDESIIYLLGYYYEIKRGEVLTYTEIKNFCDIMALNLAAWEVRALIMIDNIYENRYVI